MAIMSKVFDDKLAIVIPAMNEERSIAGVIQSIQDKLDCMIIVVDDASNDTTRRVAKSMGVIVLPHVTNLGAWRATQTGIRFALKKGMNSVVTCDADGQHPADALVTLIKISPKNNDCTIGAFTSRASVSRLVAWRVFKRISGLEVSDLTSGLRVYSRQAMQVLASQQATMFDYQDVGVLLMLKKLNMSCSEVDIVMKPREDGGSHIFHSWFAVFKYLLYTLIISTIKVGSFRTEKYDEQLMPGGKLE